MAHISTYLIIQHKQPIESKQNSRKDLGTCHGTMVIKLTGYTFSLVLE